MEKTGELTHWESCDGLRCCHCEVAHRRPPCCHGYTSSVDAAPGGFDEKTDFHAGGESFGGSNFAAGGNSSVGSSAAASKPASGAIAAAQRQQMAQQEMVQQLQQQQIVQEGE